MSNLERLLRGGGWCSLRDFCRAAFRSCYLTRDRNGDVGFRLVGVEDE